MRPILVFGRSGQVARELADLAPADTVFIGRADLDLATRDAAEAISRLKPRAVINAAAYTAVDEAEIEIDLAMRLNAQAPGQMARACAAQTIRFVHISSDYVFDGEKTGEYREADTPAPRTTYGRSKAEGETAVISSGAAFTILRTSWVFSSHGKNFLKTMLRLAQTRDEIGVVSDQVGRPTWARDIARAALSGAEQGGENPLGILHAAGPEAMSWAQFAQRIFGRAAAHGLPVAQVRPIATADYPTAAVRPANSQLAIDAIASSTLDWRPTPLQTALDACLDQLETVP